MEAPSGRPPSSGSPKRITPRKRRSRSFHSSEHPIQICMLWMYSRHMQVKAVYENSIVVEDCGRTYGKATGLLNATESDVAPSNAPLRWQTDASPDLNIMSWPPRRLLPKKYRGYVYDVGAGVGTYIYVIDNGINTQNPVCHKAQLWAVRLLIPFQDFVKMPWPPRPAEWHYAPGVRQTQTDDSFNGHGTCVASKAAGWRSGVSKNSQLVIMKASLTVADQHWAFAAALDDILAKGRQKRAVIVYPRASTQAADDAYRGGNLYMWSAIQTLIDELSREAGILVVVPAGNYATRSQRIDTFPGIWADSEPVSQGPGLTAGDVKPLVAVGAVTLTGARAPSSQGMKESQLLWAPGEKVTCAGGHVSPEQVYADGTSFAASMVLFPLLQARRYLLADNAKVAGLAAYTMSQGDWIDPLGLELKLRTRRIYSSDRKNNPEVVWNGLNGAAKALQNVSTSQSLPGRLQPLLNLTASA